MSNDEISAKPHDIAWDNAWKRSKNSPIDNLMIAKAGGATESMLEYIEENELINSLICS